MAAFTEITNGFAPQLNMAEIVNAVNERRAACISARYGFPPSLPPAISVASPQSFQGGDAKPTHLLIQEMLEALAPYYVDHDADYGNSYTLTPTSAIHIPLPYFTLATWRSRAGLHADGFRRAAEWLDPTVAPTFSYGKIQTGDIAGYWVWDDIVSGLKALRWNVRYTEEPTSNQVRSIGSTLYTGTQSAGIAAANAAWAGSSWAADAYNFNYRDAVFYYSYGGTDSQFSFSAHRSKPTFALSSAPLAGTAALMMQSSIYASGGYYDIEGRAQNDWYINQSVDFVDTATGGTATKYTITSPASTPFSDSDWSADFVFSSGSVSNHTVWIIKWTFSHS